MTFFDGATSLGTGTLDGSAFATFTTNTLAVGNHAIYGSYGGDGNFNPSTSAGYGETINEVPTSVSVSSSPGESVYGQLVTFTATVTTTIGLIPNGTVSFMEGSTVLVSNAGIDASGEAKFITSALTVGTHTITASYSGTGFFFPSTGDDSIAPQVVDFGNTTTVVSSSALPSTYGQALTLTASVRPASPAAGTATGMVTFFDGATRLGTGTLDGTAHATFSTAALAVGNHVITASYGGGGSFLGSTSLGYGEPISPASTGLIVASAPNASVAGQVVIFTATVTSAAPGTPSGTVTFSEGSTVLAANVTLNGAVQATFSITSLNVGTHTISATYSGDGSFQSTSGDDSASPQVVNKASTNTAVTSSPSPSVVGQPVTFTAGVTVVAPGAGIAVGTVIFTEGATTLASNVTLSSSGLATFSSSSLSLGTHTITATYSGSGNFLGSTATTPRHRRW